MFGLLCLFKERGDQINLIVATDGSLVSRVTYAALFQVIGTTYGIGDGATTFKLPAKTGDYTYCIKF